MNRKVLKTMIIISWVVLAVCFIIKLLGGNWFEIAVKNEHFIKVCGFIDNNIWCKLIVSFITSMLGATLIDCAILRVKFFNKSQAIAIYISVVSIIVIKAVGYIYGIEILSTITFFLDIITYCILPMILSRKVWRPIIGCVLYVAFQVISLLIKNIGISSKIDDNTLISLIFMIDVYVMSTLYYLYSNYMNKNKEVK